MATPPRNLKVTGKGLEQLAPLMRLMATVEVLVGVPAENTERPTDAEDDSGITNAAILYIQENGMPEQNIPARPSLGPAIAKNQDVIEQALANIARRVLAGNPGAVEAGYHVLGGKMAAAVKNEINEGIPPPLAESTLRQRARKGSKGAKAELERRRKGEPAGTDLAKPLVFTGELRNSINYAIRQKQRS